MLWEPPEIMKQCAEWRGMSDEECYETWNGGQGVLMVIDPSDYEHLAREAEAFGIKVQYCGEITERKIPRVSIRSRFSNKEIVFNS